jgi:hypothetical protein|tara:strand:- start:84 stop:236 length:153 start_codon:yes stop_codon:yes gene_type:complete
MKHYDEIGVKYKERSGDRLKTPDDRRDQIDVEAFVTLSMQNMVFPVDINI